MRFSIKYLSSVVLLCFTILALSVPVTASPLVGDLSVLSTTADNAEKSFNQLHTWSGHARLTVIGNPKGGLAYHSVTTVAFIADCDHDAVRWACGVSENIADHKGDPRTAIGMLWQNKLYQLQEYISDEPRPDRLTLKITPRENNSPIAVQRLLDQFSPLQYFPQLNDNTPKSLRWYKDNANNPALSGGTINLVGNVVVLDLKNGDIVNRYEFDTTQGCNLTKYFLKSRGVEEMCTVKYELTSGVFVPSSYVYTHTTDDADGAKPVEDLRIEVQFDESRINEKLPDDAFALESLGIQVGDYIDDRTLGFGYRYKTKNETATTQP